MKNIRTLFSFCFFLSISTFNYAYNNLTAVSTDSTEFRSERVLEQAFKVDNYIRLIKHPDYWNNTVVGGKSRPSNIWTRAVFYERHMALYDISKDTAVFNYAYNLSLITPQGICLLNKQIIPDDNYNFMVSGLKPGMYLAIISGAKSIKVKVMIL